MWSEGTWSLPLLPDIQSIEVTMNTKVNIWLAKLAGLVAVLTFAANAQAGVVFTFSQSGAQVVMQSSGSVDTSKLISTAAGGWGGRGIETNAAPETDIMGDTTMGALNAGFRFSPGTDQSDWVGGLFTSSNFNWTGTGSTQFSTYVLLSGQRSAGLSINTQDLVGTTWTPDVNWISIGNTNLSGLGLTAGTYSVVDAVTQEFITIQVGPISNAIPEPTSLALVGFSLAALGMTRRAKKA
jgi:hypothetical protein